MPCNADYMNPNQQEKNSKEVAEFLVYVLSYLDEKIDPTILSASKDLYGAPGLLDKFTEQLCTLIKSLYSERVEQIVYDAHNKTARRLATWWEAHLDADAKREPSNKKTCYICHKQKISNSFSKAMKYGMRDNLICNKCYPIPL